MGHTNMLRRIGLLTLAAFLITFVIAAPAPVQAQGRALPPAVIALIDIQLLLRESLAGKDIQRQVDTMRDEFRAQVTKRESDLRSEEQELSRQRAILSPEAFEEKRLEFERKVTEFQKEVQERSSQLEIAVSKARNEILRALVPIYQQVLDERKATMLVDKSQIVLPAPGLDVTTEVIEKLDQKLPGVKVSTTS